MANKERILRAFGKLNMQVTGGESRSASKSSKTVDTPKKHGIVLFCGSDISLTSAFEGLRQMKDENWRFTAVLSASAEQILSEDNILKGFGPDQILKESEGVSIRNVIDIMDALIVPNLTQNTLAKLAVGIQDELTALITWQALVSNKPVVVNTDSIFKGWFDIDNNRAMKRIMQSHVAALKGFGAKLADKHEYLTVLGGPKKRVEIGKSNDTKSGAHRPVQPRKHHINESISASDIEEKKLLTERDIKMLSGVTELTIGKGQILTPLGRDAAISKGIRIIYQRRE